MCMYVYKRRWIFLLVDFQIILEGGIAYVHNYITSLTVQLKKIGFFFNKEVDYFISNNMQICNGPHI